MEENKKKKMLLKRRIVMNVIVLMNHVHVKLWVVYALMKKIVKNS